MLFTEVLNFFPIGSAEIFSDDFLGDVPTDVLAIITGFFCFDFFLFGFEDLGADVLVVVNRSIWEDEWSFSVGGGPDELSKNGVVGFLSGYPVDRL